MAQASAGHGVMIAQVNDIQQPAVAQDMVVEPVMTNGNPVIEEMEVAADLQAETGHAPSSANAGMPQFNVDTFVGQWVWLAISFTLLYLMMKNRLIPAIENVLEHRQSRVRHDLERASELQLDAEKTHHEYELLLKQAHTRTAETFAQVEQKISKLQEERSAKLETSLKKQLAEAEKRIAEARTQALGALEEQSIALVQEIVKKMTGSQPGTKEVQAQMQTVAVKGA